MLRYFFLKKIRNKLYNADLEIVMYYMERANIKILRMMTLFIELKLFFL